MIFKTAPKRQNHRAWLWSSFFQLEDNLDNRRNDEFGYGLKLADALEHPCFECGQLTNGLHHVVPVCRGGTKQLPLCCVCHQKAHGDSANVYKSDLIREGIAKRKKAGRYIGRPSKVRAKTKHEIKRLREEGFSYKTIAHKVGLAVGTVWKIARK